ncbi:transposase-like protein [Bradyrhizobium sp. USDA 3240]
MRYPASQKAEIIQLVEQSHLPVKRTLDKLGIPRVTFYRWYDRYREGGVEALADHRSRPDRSHPRRCAGLDHRPGAGVT